MPLIEVSEEYVDRLVEDLFNWAQDPESLILSQFFSRRGMSERTFKRIKEEHPKVYDAWEAVKALLCTKWFEFGWKKQDEDLKPQTFYLFKRYLETYDRPTAKQKIRDEKEIRSASGILTANVNFEAESFADAELDPTYLKAFEENVKRKAQADK